MITVSQLRQSGYKVDVRHYRQYVRPEKALVLRSKGQHYPDTLGVSTRFSLSPYGGRTEVVITDENGNEYRGITVCSNKDNYNRKIGTMKAVNRAAAQLIRKGLLRLNPEISAESDLTPAEIGV